MRLLGILAFAAGIVATVIAIPAAFRARRPADLAWAVLAPAAALLALAGLVTIVSPSLLVE